MDLVALHRAFEDIANTKFLAYLLGVVVLALEGESGIACNHETVANARQVGRKVFGDAIGEIILAWIAGEIGEGRHNDGKMRGLDRSWIVRRDRCSPGGAKEMPRTGGAQDEQRSRCGEQRRARLSAPWARLPLQPSPRLGLPTSSE